MPPFQFISKHQPTIIYQDDLAPTKLQNYSILMDKQAQKAKESMETPTWFLGSESKPLPPYKRVQQRRLPHIGPSNQRKFWHPVRWAILPVLTTLHKLRLQYPSPPRIPTQDYVRTLQNPTSQWGFLITNINPRGNKELFYWDFNLGIF